MARVGLAGLNAAAIDPLPAVQVLHPGDVVLAQRGDRLETLLGSCVAIILTDPRRTLAAMLALLRRSGINPRLSEAYLFGGSNIFPRLYAQAHVGSNNTHWALGALADLGIGLAGQDTGGTAYRQITWTVGPDTPQVRLGHT